MLCNIMSYRLVKWLMQQHSLCFGEMHYANWLLKCTMQHHLLSMQHHNLWVGEIYQAKL